MNIIGISAFYHDSACCLLQDGKIVAAAEEERFTRIKADPSIPANAFKYCLDQAGLCITDIDYVAYYEDPVKKLDRQLYSGILDNLTALPDKYDLRKKVEQQIRDVIGYEGEIRYVDHHMSHAASAFYFSGFKEAAILTVDGVGEWATTTYGVGKPGGISIFEEVRFPHSLGLLYSTITSYLGFGVNDGEYKVMGLAPYGRPVYADQLMKVITLKEKGQYELNLEYFAFMNTNRMYSDEFINLFGRIARKEDSPIEQFHKDIAKSMQVVLENILLEKANYLFEQTGMENLCMAGGVALNCVANGKVLRNGPFKRLFVQPAANDAGGAIGAAAAVYTEVTKQTLTEKLPHAYLGPSYSNAYIDRVMRATGMKYHQFRNNRNDLLSLAASKLAAGKVLGWFHGRMEFGPRSLGARSIIADPRNTTMRDRINAMVKKREGFRPFAPAVLDHKAAEHFQLDHDSPFMLETCDVISSLSLPAITHVDNSARVQTVSKETNSYFYELLTAFNELTGCPILLNTSFNVKGEPIVCSPEDALKCFIATDIDCLVLEDYFIDRSENDFEVARMIISTELVKQSAITHDVYTFV